MAKPNSICMITTFYPPYHFGGDAIYVYRLSNELAKRGHHVEVIHCVDSFRLLAKRDPGRGYDNHPNITVHRLKSRLGFLSPLATNQAGHPFLKSKKIKQVLKKGFDVIHFHNVSLIGGPKILEYGHGTKLYTMHEYWLICPMHVLLKFNSKPCVRPLCFLCTLAFKRPPQWWRYLGFLSEAVKHVDAFIAPSRFSKDLHLERGLQIPATHVPYFVPEADRKPSTTPTNEQRNLEKPYFLFVGRLEKLKGLQTLISVFHNYSKARLLIAGTGNFEKRLRRLAKGYDNIRFLGILSSKRLETFYRHAVSVIVPSLCFDVFVIVIIEAFMHRTPAIVRKIGGMPELIEESGAGFIYETDDELVSAMDCLIEDHSHRSELGQRGYNSYKKRWSTEAHLERYFKLIETLKSNQERSRALPYKKRPKNG